MKNGCGKFKKAPYPVFKDQIGETIIVYWNCPHKFIPPSVLDFFSKYKYFKAFPSAKVPDYDDCPKWIDAWELFEYELEQVEKLKKGN